MYKLLLASRYLQSRFIALASIVSVTLGVATMIVVNSVMTGFSTQMKDRIHGILADVMVESMSIDGTDSGTCTTNQLIDQVTKIAGPYIAATTPTVEIYGMLSFKYAGQTVYRPVNLVGIVPEGKNLVSPMASYLESRKERLKDRLDWELSTEGASEREHWIQYQNESRLATVDLSESDETDARFENPFPIESNDKSLPTDLQKTRLYVGASLVTYPAVDRKGNHRTVQMVSPGQDVTLHTIKAGKPESQSWRATVVDLFKSGMSEYDGSLVFCNIEELQHARGMLAPQTNDWRDGEITSLQIRLKNPADAPRVVQMLRKDLALEHFRVGTWESKQGALLEAVAVESSILNVLLFLIIAVAGFGILAIFTMIVVEKTRDIGILKALGASGRGVMSIFLTYGLSLGVVGAGAGVGMGLLFVRYINEVEAALSWITGRKVFDETIYYFKEIPTCVRPTMVLGVATGAVLIAVLASVFPARRAAALHPVQALRHE